MANNSKTLNNSNRWSTRQLVIMALFIAISVILTFIEIPMPFIAAFLKYDASFVPAIISAVAYGPVSGMVVGVIASAIHMLIYGDLWGGLMNIILVAVVTLIAGAIFAPARRAIQQDPKAKYSGRMAAALVVSSLAAVVAALLVNLLITPIYMGVDVSVVVAMLPLLAIFNIIKVVLNSLLTALVYKLLIPVFNKKGR